MESTSASPGVTSSDRAPTLLDLFQATSARLLAFVRCRSTRALSSRRDPEDTLQAVYLQAQKRWADFARSGMAFEPWIYRITLNCLFDDHDFQSRQRRDYRVEIGWPDRSSMQMSLGLESPGTTPSEAVARQELQSRIEHVLGQLAKDHQEIMVMVHFGELSKEEAAEILGIPSGTARQRYARARARFRDVWKHCYSDHDLSE